MKIRTLAFGLLVVFLAVGTASAGELLARSDFRDGGDVFSHGTAGVYADAPGAFAGYLCTDGEGISFDYADERDDCGPDPAPDQVGSISSNRGQWGHQSGPIREVAIDFSAPVDAGACAALEALTGGCKCGEVCSRRIWIGADRVFKSKATRQSLGGRFDAFPKAGGGPPIWRINYVDPLYLCSSDAVGESLAGEWRVMQSADCSGNGDVSLAEVVDAADNSVVGEWYLPIQVLIQRVPLPAGGGDPPPPPGCTDADGDGYCAEAEGGDDCNDNDDTVHPGHKDGKGRWNNGVDNDCDGVIDG
jgi:hypothetical protein